MTWRLSHVSHAYDVYHRGGRPDHNSAFNTYTVVVGITRKGKVGRQFGSTYCSVLVAPCIIFYFVRTVRSYELHIS